MSSNERETGFNPYYLLTPEDWALAIAKAAEPEISNIQKLLRQCGHDVNWYDVCKAAGVVLPSLTLREYAALTGNTFDYRELYFFNPFSSSIFSEVNEWVSPFPNVRAKIESVMMEHPETKQQVKCVRRIKKRETGKRNTGDVSTVIRGVPAWMIQDFKLPLVASVRGGTSGKEKAKIQAFIWAFSSAGELTHRMRTSDDSLEKAQFEIQVRSRINDIEDQNRE